MWRVIYNSIQRLQVCPFTASTTALQHWWFQRQCRWSSRDLPRWRKTERRLRPRPTSGSLCRICLGARSPQQWPQFPWNIGAFVYMTSPPTGFFSFWKWSCKIIRPILLKSNLNSKSDNKPHLPVRVNSHSECQEVLCWGSGPHCCNGDGTHQNDREDALCGPV